MRVDLRKEPEGRFVLIVQDDGVGLPDGLDFERLDTLGLQLVETLTEHLDGTLDVSTTNGTKFRIVFGDIDVHQ